MPTVRPFGVRIEITQLKRTSGDTITLTFVLANDSDSELDTIALMNAQTTRTDDGVSLIDANGKKKYLVIRDSDSNCLCSTKINNVKPNTRTNLWAKFPAPPAGVTRISIAIPHFQPIDDVPISQ